MSLPRGSHGVQRLFLHRIFLLHRITVNESIHGLVFLTSIIVFKGFSDNILVYS